MLTRQAILKRQRLKMQQLRMERYSAGLTATGLERKNKRHPELAGLTGSEYHTAYMRKQREEDRKAWL